jgi:hypothetical protein
VSKVEELVNKALSRRSFLAGAGTAAAAVAVGCASSSTPPTTTTTTTTPAALTDADYLNFALNLEYLEAEYYLRSATGSGLSAADAGTGAGAVTGGAQVTGFTAVQQQYAYEIAQDELNHVRFLRQALGTAAVSRPAIDLTNSFNGAAVAAGIVATGGTFNPFSSPLAFQVGAFVFEDVGVTAYHGAAKLLTVKTNLTAAAGILAVEAYHAAEIRAQLFFAGAPYLTYANQISALRATLGGGNETPITGLSIVAADSTNAIAFERTTDQVLHIVYATGGTSGVAQGGFFPSGLNGNIKVTAS